MRIHTTSILPEQIPTKGGYKQLKVLGEGKSMLGLFSIKDKIVCLVSKKPMKTTEIALKLRAKNRTVRKFLNELEEEGRLKREKGERVNEWFRESDRWVIKKNERITRRVPKGHICVWYKTRHTVYYTHHYLLLPKIVDLDENFASAIGIIIAEATKGKLTTIEVVNSEPELIRTLIRFFGIFGVQKRDWNWRITFNKKLKEDRAREEAARCFWLKETGLNPGKEAKHSPRYQGVKEGKIRKGVPWGSLSISYNSVILRGLLFSSMETIKTVIKKDETLVAAFLRGYLAGEAYVGKDDRALQVASTSKAELVYLMDSLTAIGVKACKSKATSTSPERVIVTNLAGFLELNRLNIFSLHPYKRLNLANKILNYRNLPEKEKKRLTRQLAVTKSYIEKREKEFKQLLIHEHASL